MLPLDKLLAIKSFYFGVLSAKSSDSRRTAFAMLDYATTQLSQKPDHQSQLRLAFYYLARAELHRYEGDPLPDRRKAQDVCQAINSRLYGYAMQIVDKTTVRSRGPGRIGFLSAYGSVAAKSGETEPDHPASWWLNFSLQALGEPVDSLTDKQRSFIEHATLLDMFQKHGIASEP